MFASRDVEHAVIAEHDRATMVIGSTVVRVFVENQLAPGTPVSVELAVNRDRRS